MSKKCIGVLTSGGDCPGLNAVIRGVVKSSSQLGYDCVGFLRGYEGLHDPVRYLNLTPENTTGILNQGGTILGSTNKGRFAATVGVADRIELAPELLAGVQTTINQLGIEGLVCVGGDGSLAVAQQFHEYGIPVVGVPRQLTMTSPPPHLHSDSTVRSNAPPMPWTGSILRQPVTNESWCSRSWAVTPVGLPYMPALQVAPM